MESFVLEITLVVLVTIGAFLLGITISWLAKGYVEDYIENAAYAKSVTHPEMLDEDGQIVHDDLIYLRDMIVEDDDEDDD
ncbi:hypothetical protein CPQG_00100 [Cyanophage P-RSM3]|mgnify:FL=1|jgi:hypothetical protein|uniref:Uncharacterized protein n=3 Tax=Ronodorvirus ssm4 TaxID=2845939 RepID=M1PKD0_9CAUD|nr:hypothetical protein PSSM4_191 [Prochlorococcus phage P-SSM4]AAX46992.1 hypothetical protein PSSM4_191 [Prochlorococcus phage P-SSM4]AGF91395.1 hypothetical protein CPYG_00100 [Cyanophage P-SS1]AGH26629.1 hypothetical protein CPQG_00100 [Cyanophage P-RSM3]|tara:strand:+ start:313 stop:552 length:240 start_codon:yes stop_codon:yes gene_type:complete